MRHPDGELIGFLRGELAPAARASVEQHLEACPECRASLADFRDVLEGIAETLPEPPPVNWPRYRAELRAKLAARSERPTWWTWLRWPLPLALSASLAGVLVLLAVQGVVRQPDRQDIATAEEVLIGRRLELLRDYRVVERLDLLEDLDILRNLDALTSTREG